MFAMRTLPRHAALLAAVALALSSCQPPPRDIVVVWRNGQLVVDFPWSLWRLVGLQDRTYCVRRVELFDREKLLWTLDAKEDVQCRDVTMPLRIGGAKAGFVSKGQPALRNGVTYGIAIDGIGKGRADFALRRENQPKNETDWQEQIEPPCGSYFGECPRSEQPHRG
jgi:hypothetical protein